MKTTNLKKIVSLLMSAMLLIGMLAGCGVQEKPNTDNNSTTPSGSKPVVNTLPDGMLLVNCGAVVQVTYDTEGLVIKLEGTNESGTKVVGQYADKEYVGMGCAQLVSELIQKSIDTGFAMYTKNIVIKQAYGSALPGTMFLEGIVKEAEQSVTTDAEIVLITDAELDEEGYIDFATAKALLQSHVGLNSGESIRGSEILVDGQYTLMATVGGKQNTYTVNAVTGTVTDVQVFEPDMEDFYEETPETDPIIEFLPEDTLPVEPTQPVETQPVQTEPVYVEPSEPVVTAAPTEPAVQETLAP